MDVTFRTVDAVAFQGPSSVYRNIESHMYQRSCYLITVVDLGKAVGMAGNWAVTREGEKIVNIVVVKLKIKLVVNLEKIVIFTYKNLDC